jgi:primosomal protein N' (replication factor Y)
MTMSERTTSVALPLPLHKALTYRVPKTLPDPCRGARVLVPLGGRRVIGVCLGNNVEKSRETSLRDIIEIIDETPLAPPPLIDLAEWISAHYLAPPGECFRLILPPESVRAGRAVAQLRTDALRAVGADPLLDMLSRGPLRVSTLAQRLGRDPSARLSRLKRVGIVDVVQDLASPGFRMMKVAVATEGGSAAEAPRAKSQRELLARLESAGGRTRVADLVRGRSSLRSALAALVRAGRVRIEEERRLRDPETLDDQETERWIPTESQARAATEIITAVDARTFAPFLLFGVTGSGKTEVYLLAAERALERNLGVLIMVPEIALTPMLMRTARARFGDSVAVVHSALSRGERHDQWWRIRDGEARVVIGARSAVFSPIPDLGLIVVDEEHDAAYKQEECPRYQARDVAVMRAKIEGAPIVLGSATPSVESYTNALGGRYRRLDLPLRIGPRGLAGARIVDRRATMRAGGDPVLTPPLREALTKRLARGEQALLLLNRRGYAQCLLCRECGAQAMCPSCSVSLTVHRTGERMLCHYCGHEARAQRLCGACGGEYLRLTGCGTEKIVEAIREAFPNARVDRLDSDRVDRKNAALRLIADFENGRIDVLVGTQMIAKGHDFPKVTLVGVIDADVGLGLPDFRAAERTFQLLTQVAGRSGRGNLAGEVILQSYLPEHYALRFACDQDYAGFYEHEMAFRRSMDYPPRVALVNVIVRSTRLAKAQKASMEIARELRRKAGDSFRVLGPAAAPLSRLREEHRWQILLKGRRTAMREAVRSALVHRFGDMQWTGVIVDVDPNSLM